VLGVTLGSPVIQFFGWRTLFWGQLVLLVIASVVVALLLPSDKRVRRDDAAAGQFGDGRRSRRLRRAGVWDGMDWVGIWSLAGSVTAAMLVLSIGPIVGWSAPPTITCGVVAAVLAVVFVRQQMTFATPLVPATYWRRRNFMFPMGTKAFASFAYFGGFFLFPLLMEQVYGYSVSQVGFISVARPLVFAISAPIAGYMTVRTGERTATLFGAASLFLSMILFATLSASAGLFIILVALALSGLGMGVSNPATSATMSNELKESEYGVMSAAQLLAAQVGEVAGIQAVLTIQESIARRSGLGSVHHSTALLQSFSVAFWVGAGAAGLAVVCGLFIRSMPRHQRAAQRRADTG
jgi:predicted MFS family arabinose efflux permease